MKLIYLKSALQCNSLDVTIFIKIPIFRVSVTIEPGCSLLQFVTTNCLIFTVFLTIIFQLIITVVIIICCIAFYCCITKL